MIPEALLHFIWKHSLFDTKGLSFQNEKIEIVDPGMQNNDAGPDFINAKIRIGKTLWAGNVEVHISASDWKKHAHNTDKAYDNVIVHAVANNDEEVYRTNGEKIPAVVIEYNPELLSGYKQLLNSNDWLPCSSEINSVDKLTVKNWLRRLMMERLENKVSYINHTLAFNNNAVEQTFYECLARNFGFKTNALPFEMLARSLPYKCIAKHKNNLFQIEAMLFGQSGLLMDADSNDEYVKGLKKEYLYMQRKFDLKPLDKHTWKFLRIHPTNFPTVRIAEFAALLYKSSSLYSKITDSDSIKKIISLFDVQTSKYWDTHYMFSKTTAKKIKTIGKSSVDNIIINTVVPFLFFHGENTGDEEYKNRAAAFLEDLSPEGNSIISKWRRLGVKAMNAFDSQALLQLKTEYCDNKRCLECHIGGNIITQYHKI